MIDRRQFAKGTASAVIAFQAQSLWAAAGTKAPDGALAEFSLRDYLGVYDFPEELLSYHLKFPAGVKRGDLSLVQKGSRKPLPMQLADVEEKEGLLKSATLYFRSGLKRGEGKGFQLLQGQGEPAADAESVSVQDAGEGRLSIQSNSFQVLVPSAKTLAVHLPVSQAPAPLLAVAREKGDWVGKGRLEGPDSLIVESVDTKIVDRGPLFLKYSVAYSFGEGRTYTAVLTVQTNESYVLVDEYSTSLGPDDKLAFRFSYKQGLDPDGRLVMQNGGYSTGGPQQCGSGAYDQKTDAKGMLPFKLGIYTPNSINLPRAVAFWNDGGKHAMLFALRRLPDWKTSERALWSASSLPDNLTFFADPKDGDKYMRAPIVGAERHWAVGLIRRDDLIVRGVTWGDSDKFPPPPEHSWKVVNSMQGLLNYGAGPEVRLLQKLNDFSLDRYKNCIFEFEEDERTAAFRTPHPDPVPTKMTASDYAHEYGKRYMFLAQMGWDVSGEMGANHWGWSIQPQANNYAYNCTGWSAAERLQLRSRIVFAAYLMELDTAMPQSSMLGGHPNFAAEYKQVLGIVAGLFPRHPHANRWKDAYFSFWNQFLDKYIRKTDPETGALGGRFTESIACYNYASMEAVCMAAIGLKRFDGTQLLDHPVVRDWVRWEMKSRLPFVVDGARIVPSQGAHAAVSPLAPGGRWYNVAYATAHLLRDTDPTLADQWLWSITAGAEGKAPAATPSAVFSDYGAVLHHDFGGPDEAYLHMQQLNGIGYRWGTASNGAIYYAAKGKVWSWNRTEINGDLFDITGLPLLRVDQSSLGDSATPGVLYDFDIAQYYRADATPRPNAKSSYRSRGVMMVRGDYIAIDDRLEEGQSAAFQWKNESNGLTWQVFGDTDFHNPVKTIVDDWRFPLSFDETLIRALGINSAAAFSIRATSKFMVPAAGRYSFSTMWNNPKLDIPSGDTVRFYLDDQKIFDGKGHTATDITLEARAYAIRFEYIHASSQPPSLMVAWKRPDQKGMGQIEAGYFLNERPMPFLHELQGGPGNQLHLVAPEKLDVAAVAARSARVCSAEYVLFGETAIAEKNLKFSGSVGYAKEGALALFEGTHIEWNGLGLSKSSEEFGASVKLSGASSLEGKIAGRSGGKLRIHLPSGFHSKSIKATFDGKSVPVTVEGSTVILPVTIVHRDGVKTYTLTAS